LEEELALNLTMFYFDQKTFMSLNLSGPGQRGTIFNHNLPDLGEENAA